jgi:acetylornithine/N-succinyldiaminopimelate aminotransferase
MNNESVMKQDAEYVLHSYGRANVAIKSGKGSVATDYDNKQYIDFTSGIGVNVLGYCPENWVKAVTQQLTTVQHICNYYYNDNCTEMAEAVTKAAGMSRVFFCNSGAEANECAIKVARKVGAKKGKSTIITLVNSFHGRTLTTLAATGQDAFHKLFLPLTDGFKYVEAGNYEALKEALTDDVCAVMLECVQGEGGVLPMSDEYLKQVRKLCDDKDILMLVDEVQTGVGRTGYFFSYQSAEITPDVVTAAKGLGGGLPIGTCLVSEKYKDIFVPGDNGSTFGGNPVVCAGGREIVKTVSNSDFLAEVRAKGVYFKKKLEAMKNVEFVRGKGMMIGISVKGKNAKEILTECAKNGLLVLTAKDLVRFLPPLNISYEEIDKGLEIFNKVIG